MHEKAKELVGILNEECENMQDVHDLLKSLFKDTIEKIFEAEMNEHLSYQKNDVSGNNSGNSRNGYNTKTIQTQFGKTELKLPETETGSFSQS